MKLLIAVLALVALAGCGKRSEADAPIAVPAPYGYLSIVRVRGCEYVAGRECVVHAGDCDNPIHKEARP